MTPAQHEFAAQMPFPVLECLTGRSTMFQCRNEPVQMMKRLGAAVSRPSASPARGNWSFNAQSVRKPC
jgi:hypothetical protein